MLHNAWNCIEPLLRRDVRRPTSTTEQQTFIEDMEAAFASWEDIFPPRATGK